MISHGLFSSNKPSVQVCAGTEHLAMSSLYNTLYSVINIEKCVRVLKLSHHRRCEGIVLLWSVQRYELNRCDFC